MDPGGSSLDPEEVGNTIPSSGPAKKKDTRKAPKKTWHLTLRWPHGSNGANVALLRDWIIRECKTAVWQLEEGQGETAYRHMQLTLTLKEKKRWEWFSRHLCPHVHVEVANNIEASFDYCMKSDTRVAGPWFWPERVKDSVKDPMHMVVFYRYQQKIIDIISNDVDPRKIYWFWEPEGNVGKSDFCVHLILNWTAIVFDGAKKDILHAYNGERIVIFDLSRSQEGHISYDALEQLKKGFCFSGKYESKMKVYEKPHVIVFANWAPDETALSADRWCVEKIEIP